MSKKLLTTALFLVALSVALILSFATRTATTHAGVIPANDVGLTPANLSALTSPTSVTSAIPRAVDAFGDLRPLPGTVHQLGNGAVAWTAQGRVCWVALGAGGCVQGLNSPIDWTLRDPDVLGSGAPLSVFGLAIDSVKLVTVTLSDGSTLTATPVGNYYNVALPASAGPDSVASVTATMADGSSSSLSLSQ